jgi:hypothetical protein
MALNQPPLGAKLLSPPWLRASFLGELFSSNPATLFFK